MHVCMSICVGGVVYVRVRVFYTLFHYSTVLPHDNLVPYMKGKSTCDALLLISLKYTEPLADVKSSQQGLLLHSFYHKLVVFFCILYFGWFC